MELSKNFEPQNVDAKWYTHWITKGYFHSTPDEREPYTIVIPPPNVTGILHMGHCLNNTIQDILIRHARMQGKNACWVPGTDHASIATEAKVVAMLREKGITKSSLGRDEFLRYAWEWKEKYGGIILEQLKKLGCSLDWHRLTFTMDEDYYKSVIRVFVDLYNKGWIYRGKRMINWDVKAKTALSDEEVIYKEVQSKLYYIRYRIADSSQLTVDSLQLAVDSEEMRNPAFVGAGEKRETRSSKVFDSSQLAIGSEETRNEKRETRNFLVVATARPETILGDTAICVHPDDERYKHLHRKFVLVPLINRRIPIITDEYVAMEFGTGALKVTPAHDVNDYQLGKKYKLDIIDVLNDDGTMNEAAQLYIGEDRFEARKKIVNDLEAAGHIEKVEDYTNQIGFSERTDAVVEPKLSLQWWVSMKHLSTPALQAVMNDEINFHPTRFKNLYRHWMENIQDWCISRQLWWGHRIPAWYDEGGNVYVAENEEVVNKQYEGVTRKLLSELLPLKQDEDCLDTWFSSWLWPFEVFKGLSQPRNVEEQYYYPTNTLVTAPEIIFFWVARMIMAGYEYMNEKPFTDVYFTGIVRDKQGRKMSKQLGNSPDLLSLIDKYGADAVRFGIMIASPAGNDLLWDESSNEQGRNFNNKLWNATKLVKMWGEKQSAVASSQSVVGSSQLAVDSLQLRVGSKEVGSSQMTIDSERTRNPAFVGAGKKRETRNFPVLWFDSRLNEVKAELEILFKQFRLSEALKTIYSLIWDDFCSWYLEWVKPNYEESIDAETYQKTIHFFDELLQLLHPFMPFITEEIYHLLAARSDDLCVKQLSAISYQSSEILMQGKLLKEVITAIRDAKNKNQIKSKEIIKLHIQTNNPEAYSSIENILSKQINAESIYFTNASIANAIVVAIETDKFFIQTEKKLDTASLKDELLKDLDYQTKFLESVNKKLTNERFVKNAKPDTVELEKKKQADAEARIKTIEESLATL